MESLKKLPNSKNDTASLKRESCKKPNVVENQGKSTCKEAEKKVDDQCPKDTSKKTEKAAEEDEAAATGDEGDKKREELVAARRSESKTAPQQPQKTTQMKQ